MRPISFLTPAFVVLAMLGSSYCGQVGTSSSWPQVFHTFYPADSSLLTKPVISCGQEFISGGPSFLNSQLEYHSHELLEKCGFSFDAMQNETMPGMYGPTSVMIHRIGHHAEVWESELLALAANSKPLISGGFLHSGSPSTSLEKVNFMTGISPTFGSDRGAEIPTEPDSQSFSPTLPLHDSHELGFRSNSSLALLMMVSVMIVLVRVRRTRLTAG